MRILIDLQGAQSASRHRGIGRYTLALALAMAKNKGEHEIHLLLNGMLAETIRPIRDAFKAWIPANHIHVWQALAPVNSNAPENAVRRRIAAIIREDAISQIQPDVVHITSLYDGFGDNSVHSVHERAECLVAITFYDAIPLIQAAAYLDNNPVYRDHYLACTAQAKNADLLLAISESARQEAVTYLQADSHRVINISSAVDPCFMPVSYSAEQTRDLQRRLGIRKPFVMYSGATDERKNHRGLISAFAQLPTDLRHAHQLVLAGGLPADHREQLEAHVRDCGLAQDEVVITGRISDDDLVQLYCQCALYVFPSWHEGFGLPALEAMSCGAATIGANTTSVPEVIGWERALFDPYDPADIAQKMAEALTDADFHQELRAHALRQATQFSWDNSALRTIAALEDLVSKATVTEASVRPDLLPAIAQMAAEDASLDLMGLSQAIARNHRAAKPQLLVDISELVQRDARTGIQRVVRSILHEWLSHPPEAYEVRAVYATTDKPGYRYADRFVQNFMGAPAANAADPDAAIDYAPGDIFLALDMQPQVQIYQSPFYQTLRNHGVDVRFVLYDLLPITMPQFFPEDAEANHSRWVSVAAQTDGVICISQSVADEFKAWCQKRAANLPQIDWFHMGADIESSTPSQGLPEDAVVTLDKLSMRPTFLMVGTVEPRKGHAQVLDAANALWNCSADFNLVLVGKQGWKVEKLVNDLQAHSQLGERLFWLQGISDEYLAKVYAQSDCLIAASYGEGFGLPLIEAAQIDLPIIARDIPVFREVAGDYATYFNSVAGLESVISNWVASFEDRQDKNSKHMPWQTWGQSAAQLLQRISTRS
ncbi:glycosyltransferase family 4 protein [Comamonas koreensis]|uniref:Glycosyltransferase family 4 protein n=1 Tax=Comamonas koreensis TaxID=160825 RepID=A0AAW4XVP3_9BURK|nr:glycosyltransferase family 1 protein [Comamonas koreensis]MCD2165497.1 glycosyltransferase family 4 protein [Comamonas koreensis]